MKVSLNFDDFGFWFRNGLRALVIWLWFDHGRVLATRAGFGGFSTEGLVIVSVFVVLLIEGAFLMAEDGLEENEE